MDVDFSIFVVGEGVLAHPYTFGMYLMYDLALLVFKLNMNWLSPAHPSALFLITSKTGQP